jgi:hypothetical protein
MSTPAKAGRIDKSRGDSVHGLHAESLELTDWDDVARALGGSKRPQIATAVAFYRDVLAHEFAGSFRSAYLELLGIDFSSPVQRVNLSVGQMLTSYVKTVRAQPGARPHEGRVRVEQGNALMPLLGRFFAVQGTALNRLGIHDTGRTGFHFRVMLPVVALQSRASGIVDAWSDTPTLTNPRLQVAVPAIPRMAGGGGVQFRVPRSNANTTHFQPA